MQLKDVIEKRHSVRRFSTKKVKIDDIIECIDAANKSPLAGNISVLRFILVDDKDKIQKLADAAQQDFISEVDQVVVVCSKKDEAIRSYDERAEMYMRQQAGASIENFLLRITDLGLASCWTGAFVEDMVKQALQVPTTEDMEVEAILPIGYEMVKTGKQAKKTNLDNVLYFNKWKEKKRFKKIEAL